MVFQEALDFATINQIVLCLYGGLTCLVFVFGSDLLGRYYKADKQTRGDAAHMTFFAMGLALMGYGAYMVTQIYNLYFAKPAPAWIYFLLLFIVTLILSAITFTVENFIFSRQRILKVGHFNVGIFSFLAVFGIIYLLVIGLIEMINPAAISVALGTLLLIPSYIIIGLFVIVSFLGVILILFIRLSPEKAIKRKIFFGFFAGFIVLVGSGAVIEILGRNGQNLLYITGTLIEISGWVVFRQFLLSIPSYSELDWKDGLIELNVIMAESGLSLYSRKFHKLPPGALKGDLEVTTVIPEAQRPDSDLTGGAMIGIQGLLSEIAGTRGKLKNVQIGEKNLVFNQGEVLLVLLLTDGNLGVYHSILYKLVRAIEEANPNLKNFSGDTSSFSIEPVVDHFFGPAPQAPAKQLSEDE